MSEIAKDALPATPYIKTDDAGGHYLQGQKCAECGAVYLGSRNTCSRCFARDRMEPVRLAERGTLHTFSIVYRSYPGIPVPYISAVVDLDDGTTVKSNLINVEPDPANISFGMPVQVVFKDALGRKDSDGNSYVSFFFEPV